MKRLLPTIVLPLAMAIACGACASPHPEEAEVLAVFDQLVDALQRSDLDTVWALTDPDTQRELLDLLREAHEALALVPAVYPDDDAREQARAALGDTLLGSIFAGEERAGPRLLSRLLATDLLRRDQSARDGVDHRDVTVASNATPLRAIVHTSGGESFAFVKSAEGWRSLLVRDLLIDNLAIRELRDNTTKVKHARDERATRWRTSRDPRHPQGGYNIARAAIAATPRDGALLYGLLDPAARAVLVTALESARQVQRAIQRRTTRKQRRRAYAAAGLTLYVDATSDRDLFFRWVQSDHWVSPLGATDAPERLDGDADSGSVVVITESGARVPMARGDDGFWRPSDQATALSKALLEPMTRQLSERP